jgi:hypothetical protein
MIDIKKDNEVHLQNNKIPPLMDEQIKGGYIVFDECSFSHWRGLLDQWIENINKFCESNRGVNPYKDNEMCNVGLLEAAAWMSGGIAISEHRIQFNNNKWGRLDLWMKLPGYEKIELIEAKHTTNLKLTKKNGGDDKYDYNVLKQDLKNRATKDIMVDFDENKERKVVLLFLTFNRKDKNIFCDKTKNSSTEDKIKNILKIVTGAEPSYKDGYIQQNDWHLTAWCFPEKMRKDEHPGIIMSVKTI